MASQNIGTAYIAVKPSTEGFVSTLSTLCAKNGGSSGQTWSSSFGSALKSGAIMGVVSSVFSSVTSAISSNLSSAISRVDTLNNFPKVMQNLGYSADEAEASIAKLSDGINGMPTSLDSITSMTQQLAPLCDSLDEATDLSLAMNNMLLASGASTADQTRAMQQYTQALSKGKFELNDWRTLQEVMPGQLNQVAQALLGATANSTDLYDALSDGTVSVEDFNDAILQLNDEGVDGFASFADQAKDATDGIGTAMENVQNRISKAIGNVIDHIGQSNISGVINDFSSQFSAMGDVVCDVWDGIVATVDWETLKTTFSDLASAIGDVWSEGDSATGFGETVGGAINGIVGAVQVLTPLFSGLSSALKFVVDNLGIIIPLFVAVKAALAIGGIVQSATAAFNLFTGATAAATPVVTASVPQMLAMSAAVIALGAGIALACAGVSLLVLASTQLATAGTTGFIALGVCVGVVALFAAGLAVLGPVLTASAVGLVAFGIAAVAVGVGVLLACTGITLLATQLPTIATFGASAAGAIVLLGAGCVVLGVGAGVAAVGVAALAVATVALAAAMVALAATVVVCAAGVVLMGAGLALCAASAPILAVSLVTIGAACVVIAASGTIASVSLAALAVAVAAAGVAVSAAAIGFGVFAAAISPAASSSKTLATSIVTVASSAGVAAASITVMNSGLSTLSSRANTGSSAMQKVGTAATTMGASVKTGASSAASSAAQLAATFATLMATATAAAASIKSSFNNIRLHIPSPTLGAMPHFYISGSFNYETGAVPTIGVNWYAKGGIFSSASVIGVGEAGDEVVAPIDKLMGYITKAVGGGGGTTYNLYVDGARVNDDAEIRDQMLDLLLTMKRKGAMNVG